MTTFDWYILRLFARIFLICFVSLSGLFIVVHIFTNLDEVVEITRELGGPREMAEQFYLPRVFLFFDQMVGMLILAAAIFAFTFLQRNNEITALEAGGVSKARIVRPLIIAAVFLVAFSVFNREVLLPKHQASLVRTAQTWLGKKEIPMPFEIDPASGIVFRGENINPASRTITRPEFQIPSDAGNGNRTTQVSAEIAVFRKRNRQHPAGYLVSGLDQDVQTVETRTDDETNPIVFASDHYRWLADDQCFVACSMSTDQIVFGNQMKRFTGLPQLVRDASNPAVGFNNNQRVAIHARIIRPFLDFSMLLLGLPLAIARRDRNIFMAAGMCLGIVLLIQLVMMASHSLGAMRMLRPTSLAAWLPLIVFLPWAMVSIRNLNK